MKYWSHILAFFPLLLVSLSNSPTSAQELTVLYTANANGKLMFCNCPNDPYGGFSERVTLIGDLRVKEKDFLLVDAGSAVNLFGDYDLMAISVFRMMNMMKYDALGAGRNEVFRGVPRILETAKKANFSLLSASFLDTSTGKPLFKPFMTKRVGKVVAAVTSVADSTTFLTVKPKEPDFTLLPAKEALGRIIEDMDTAADFIIVLSQMRPESNRALLDAYPAIDLIVEGFGNNTYDPPIELPGGIIVSPGTYGENVGLITLNKTSMKTTITRAKLIPVRDIPENPDAHNIVLEYYRTRK